MCYGSGAKRLETRQSLIAIRSYIETALRLAELGYSSTTDIKYKEKLYAIIVGLKIALDNILNEY